MAISKLRPQIDLLVKTLSAINGDERLALKGGIAINYFHNDLPRYSIDIDLVYLPIKDRVETLKEITQSVKLMKTKVEAENKTVNAEPKYLKGQDIAPTLFVKEFGTEIKVEINTVIRGSVYPSSFISLSPIVQNEFNVELDFNTLSKADVYGGKMCAALDRQHARDLFDIKVLFDQGGITDDMRKAFLIYLASGPRPMSELLNPNFLDIKGTYDKELAPIMRDKIPLNDLLEARQKLVNYLRANIKQNEKEFLLSIKEGEPDWNKLDIKGIDKLAGITWKVENIKKMSPDKKTQAKEKLKKSLEF